MLNLGDNELLEMEHVAPDAMDPDTYIIPDTSDAHDVIDTEWYIADDEDTTKLMDEQLARLSRIEKAELAKQLLAATAEPADNAPPMTFTYIEGLDEPATDDTSSPESLPVHQINATDTPRPDETTPEPDAITEPSPASSTDGDGDTPADAQPTGDAPKPKGNVSCVVHSDGGIGYELEIPELTDEELAASRARLIALADSIGALPVAAEQAESSEPEITQPPLQPPETPVAIPSPQSWPPARGTKARGKFAKFIDRIAPNDPFLDAVAQSNDPNSISVERSRTQD